jgi:hypothetical protein
MITSREIMGHLREAQERGLNLYWRRFDSNGYSARIIGARTRKGTVEVLVLNTGEWKAVTTADAFYIQ